VRRWSLARILEQSKFILLFHTAAVLLFYAKQKKICKKLHIFKKRFTINHFWIFASLLSVASVAPTSEIRASAILYNKLQEIKKSFFTLASNSIIILPNYLKIRPPFLESKYEEDRQT
jgi:hypothetical protein